MNRQTRIITVTTFSLLGILCIISGIMYNSLKSKNVKEKVLVIVEEKQISKEEDIDIKLKNITIEVNTPLSVKIIDYLDNAISDEVLANLKLDTSSVNVTEEGTYNYTIKYKKKIYKGIIIVKAKEVSTTTPWSITLKSINVKVGTKLSQDLADYVIEPLTDELKMAMILNLNNVNVNKAGTYQYTVTYNNSIYTGNITITEDQPTLSTNIQENSKEENIANNPQEQENEPNTNTNINDTTTTNEQTN